MRTIIGVMGGAKASAETVAIAEELGRLIAENGWVLLTGGRNTGVMAAASRGAAEAGGLVVGVLPDDTAAHAAPHVDIAIPTGMGDARNAINVLASHVVIALDGGAGTLSEVALALVSERPVIALGLDLGPAFARFRTGRSLVEVTTAVEAIAHVRRLLAENPAR